MVEKFVFGEFMMKNRQGFVYLLIIAAVLAAVVFSLTLSNLNQGFRKQVSYVAHKDVCFEMAYSVLSGIMAKVYSKPWSERFFTPTPAVVNDATILDGTYDFVIEDAPGKEHQFDAYIRVKLLGQKRVYFWRIEYHDSMLDISQSFSKIYFTNLDENKFPVGSSNRIATEVDRILTNRELNREKSERFASILKGSNNSKDIAELMGAPKPVFPANDFPGFNPLKPKAPEIIETPSILSPPIEEKPQDPGTSEISYNSEEVDHKKTMEETIQRMQGVITNLESANESSGNLGSDALGKAISAIGGGYNSALSGGYDSSVFSYMNSVIRSAQDMMAGFEQICPGSDALLEMTKVGNEFIEKATEALEKAIAIDKEIYDNYLNALAEKGSSEMSEEELAEFQAFVEDYERKKAVNDRLIADGEKYIEDVQSEWNTYLQGLIDSFPTDPGWQEFASGTALLKN